MKSKSLSQRSLAVVLTTILLLVAIPATAVFAASSGSLYPGSTSGSGWTSASSIGADDTNYATYAISGTGTTTALDGTNYSFNIPANSRIDGITVDIGRASSSTGGNNSINDVSVQLLGGTLPGDNKATITDWPCLFGGGCGIVTATYGGTADTWGNTWTAAQINNAAFGVTLSAQSQSASGRTASVDFMRITVTYTAPTPPTVTTQAISSIGTTTATGNGSVTALGVPNPSAHGVVWNTTGTPTTLDSMTDLGAKASTGAFIASMTGLTPGTLYYVRAFATNTAGTSYGTQVPFTTATTLAVASPSSVTYGSTGTLTSTGGSGAGAVTYSVGGSTGCNITVGTTLNVSNASGTCDVTATKAANGVYAAQTSASYPVTLNKATQGVVSVTGPSAVTYGATGTAAASGGSGTGTYSFSTTGSTGCSVIGTTISVSDASGTCSITATRASDNNYNVSATSAPFTVTLNKANQATLTVTGPASVTFGATGTITTSGGSGTGAMSYAAVSSTGCTVNASTGVITVTDASGTCTVNAAKAIDNNYNSATSANVAVILNKATATITVNGYTGTYDGLAHGASLAVATGVNSEDLTASVTLGSTFTNVPGGTANWSFTNGNYVSQNGSASIVINPAAATITVNGYTGTYDGLAHGASLAVATGVNSEDLTASVTLGSTFTNVPGGTANWSFASGNYVSQNGSASIVIDPAAATITVNGYTGTYDGLAHGASLAVATGVNSEDLTASVTLGSTFTNVPGGTANWSFASGNYVSQNGSASIVIDPAAATITVNGYTGTYDGLAHGASLAVATGVNSEDLTAFVTLGSTFTNVPGGTANWSFTNGNYVSQNGSASIVIDPAAATITVNGYTGTYDGLAHGASLAVATGVNSEDLTASVTLGSTFTNVPGGTANWSFASGNYVSQNGSASIVINPAAATITVNGYTGTYDGLAHGASLAVATGVNSEDLTAFVTLGSTFTNVPGGTANWSFASGNYVSQNGSASIVIDPAAATITVNGYTGTYDGLAHGASLAVATGVNSEDLTAFVTLGSTFTNVPGGTANWSFASGNYVSQNGSASIIISQIAASVTAVDNSKVFGASDPALTTTNSGFLAGDLGAGKITFSATRAAGEAINTYVISPAADDASTGLLGNYSVTLTNGTFTISDKLTQTTLIVVAAPSTVAYGNTSTLSTSGGSGTGAVSFDKGSSTGCSILGTTLAVTDPNGTCSVTATKAADADYNSATSAALPVTLTKATLTVTANNQTIPAGSADPAFTFVYSGFVNGESGSVLTTAPTCGVSSAHAVAGVYDILCSSGAASNYTFSYVKGTLTVTAVSTTPIFADVPFSYWANSYIERLYNAGITGGCSLTPLNYCPDNTVTRAQMAVFLLKGIHGSSYTAPAIGTSTGFTDVPVGYWAAAWIKQLAAEGITGGCGTGIYCPDATVTRAQMAIFLLKAEHGSSYLPSAAIGTFTDVPVSYWAASWIEQLALEGITSGCGTGTYCPDAGVTRAQMAVFLVKTFNLP